MLQPAIPAMRRHSWVWATAIGAGIAWLLGMIPSTVAALAAPVQAPAQPTEPGPLLQYGLGSALGLALGLVLGFAQWIVLRQVAVGPGRWVAANAAAWAVGMPLVFVGMDVVPWSSGPWAIIPSMVLTSGAVGSVVGAMHGLVLLRILRDTSASGNPSHASMTDSNGRPA